MKKQETSEESHVALDIVIPVFNEGDNITPVLESFRSHIRNRYRVLICYDFEGDNTLAAVKSWPHFNDNDFVFVRNPVRGPHAAVLAGFKASQAPAILVYPADDDYNAPQIDKMIALSREGYDIVCASRFARGGSMKECPWLKSLLVRMAGWSLFHLGRIPTRDASNGLRMFSKSLIEEVQFESNEGFTYSIELLVKAHRMGRAITEVPVQWFQRKKGESRFKVLKWLPAYLQWYFYAFATTYFRRTRIQSRS